MNSIYSVVIPAAGRGVRLGSAVPKALVAYDRGPAGFGSAAGRGSIVRRTVDVFASDASCSTIVVCVPHEWRAQFAEALDGVSKVVLVDGGATRQESVRLGVDALAEQCLAGPESIVLVHDAARCCVTLALIRVVVAGVVEHGAVTAAVPVSDALCRAERGELAGYVDREGVSSVQTPQGFVLGELREAHRAAAENGVSALDDAGLVGNHRPVRVIPGERFNIKITHPEDLALARLLLG
jgi:2-C-methyl-D-erythritol 4-phosphate cytidylyltransferase